jgi:hypothetical protein
VSAGRDARGGDPGGHQGAASVGADDEPRRLGSDGPAAVTHDHTDRSAGAVTGKVDHGGAETESRSRLLGGVHQYRVQNRAARCVQGIDAGVRLQRDRHDVAAVVERHPPDRRHAGRHHPIEQAPAPQLEDAAAHERVGGQGVRAAAGAIDDQHPQAGAGEQEGGRRAGDACADDDGVPAAIGARPAAGGALRGDVESPRCRSARVPDRPDGGTGISGC